MKKLFAFLLAALTAASVTATAFAQEAAPSATLQVGCRRRLDPRRQRVAASRPGIPFSADDR